MDKCLVCKDNMCGGSCCKDFGLLMLRLIIGAVFIYHGFAKVSNIEGTLGFFSTIGLGNIVLVYLAAYGEFVGGIMLVLGIFTRYTALLLAFIAAVAIYAVHFKAGFNIMKGGYEYALTLMVVSLAISMIGSGKYSLLNLIKKEEVTAPKI
jgi:putative oxidoreductase